MANKIEKQQDRQEWPREFKVCQPLMSNPSNPVLALTEF